MIKSFFDFPSLATAALAYGGESYAKKAFQSLTGDIPVDWRLPIPTNQLSEPDKLISRLASNYAYLSTTIMKEFIEFPSNNQMTDIHSFCEDFSQFLIQKIIEVKGVENENDIGIDELGNVVWSLYDPLDTTPLKDRKVIFINSSYSTFLLNRTDWSQFGAGLDAYKGLIDEKKVDPSKLEFSLPYMPQKVYWKHLTFGKGASSGLQGIAAQIIAMKILAETKAYNGVVIVASISRNNHSPFHIVNKTKLYPDVIIISEATGSITKGPCGFAIAQNGQAMVEVSANHGFRIEDGCRIIAEAAAANLNHTKFKKSTFQSILNPSSQVVQDVVLEPSHFSARFVRTLNIGETGDDALEDIERLPSVQKLLGYGGSVTLSEYESFPAWKIPRDNPTINIISETYRRAVSPYVDEATEEIPLDLKRYPFFIPRGRGDSSTGYPIDLGNQNHKQNLDQEIIYETNKDKCSKSWIEIHVQKGGLSKTSKNVSLFMPPTFAVGSGLIENSGMPGEFVSNDLIWAPIAILARFPEILVDQCK